MASLINRINVYEDQIVTINQNLNRLTKELSDMKESLQSLHIVSTEAATNHFSNEESLQYIDSMKENVERHEKELFELKSEVAKLSSKVSQSDSEGASQSKPGATSNDQSVEVVFKNLSNKIDRLLDKLECSGDVVLRERKPSFTLGNRRSRTFSFDDFQNETPVLQRSDSQSSSGYGTLKSQNSKESNLYAIEEDTVQTTSTPRKNSSEHVVNVLWHLSDFVDAMMRLDSSTDVFK